jgi:hypothetical protein
MTRALILLYMLALVPAAAAGDDFLYCTTCHGADGNGNRAIRAPKIAGMEPWYVEAQLAAFRAGWRGTDPADAPDMRCDQSLRCLPTMPRWREPQRTLRRSRRVPHRSPSPAMPHTEPRCTRPVRRATARTAAATKRSRHPR